MTPDALKSQEDCISPYMSVSLEYKSKITVIIPTLNEAGAIGKVLSEMPHEILERTIVVDSSDDETPKIAQSFNVMVIREKRKGYGRALQTGVENAGGDIVIYMDGDGTYDPKDIFEVIGPILRGNCDVVLGNRFSGRAYPGALSFVNRIGNIVLSLIFSFVFLVKVYDTQCGLRAIKKQFLTGLIYRDYGMSYVTEQLAKLVKRGARICNVPVTYKPRLGNTKLCRWKDGFKILKTILRERLCPTHCTEIIFK